MLKAATLGGAARFVAGHRTLSATAPSRGSAPDFHLALLRDRPAVLFVDHTLGDGDGDLLDMDRLFALLASLFTPRLTGWPRWLA